MADFPDSWWLERAYQSLSRTPTEGEIERLVGALAPRRRKTTSGQVSSPRTAARAFTENTTSIGIDVQGLMRSLL